MASPPPASLCPSPSSCSCSTAPDQSLLLVAELSPLTSTTCCCFSSSIPICACYCSPSLLFPISILDHHPLPPHALDLYHAYIRALVLKALRPPALYPFPTPTIPHPPLTTQGTLRQCSRGAIRLFPRTLLPTSLYYPCLCSPRSCAAVAKSRQQSRAAAGELPKLEVSCRASLSHHLTSISRHDTVDQRQSGDVRRFGQKHSC